MTPEEEIKFLKEAHNTQKQKHEDYSMVLNIRRATKAEIIRAYKRIGKPLPTSIAKPMRLVKRKAV